MFGNEELEELVDGTLKRPWPWKLWEAEFGVDGGLREDCTGLCNLKSRFSANRSKSHGILIRYELCSEV